VQVRELKVPGALEITPRQFGDDRGKFLEWFKDSTFSAAVGHRLDLAQANCSVSARGVLRGIHYADVPPGQAKYVTCVRGAVLDVAIDIRVGSPTFGTWDSVLLDTVDRRVIYLAEGLGHAFLSLEDDSTVVYLCSTGYAPEREREIHPLDPALGIAWPTTETPQLSPKDAAAPTLAEARDLALLPQYDVVTSYLSSLRKRETGA
jgi:dTDP-4-dehydrorhamnose 3,5-epimerase